MKVRRRPSADNIPTVAYPTRLRSRWQVSRSTVGNAQHASLRAVRVDRGCRPHGGERQAHGPSAERQGDSFAAKAVIRVSSLKTLASSRVGRQASVPQASTPASFLPSATAREDAIRVRPAGTQTTSAAGIDAASMARRCQTPSQTPEAFLFASQPSCQATSDKRQATSDKRQAPARGPGVLPFALPWQQARPGPRLDPRLLTLTFFSVALHGSVRQRRFSGCNAGRIPTSNVVSLMSGFRLIAVVDNSAGVRSHGHGPAPPRRVGFRRPSVAPS
jgi:hypothetical protein